MCSVFSKLDGYSCMSCAMNVATTFLILGLIPGSFIRSCCCVESPTFQVHMLAFLLHKLITELANHAVRVLYECALH